MTNNRIQWIDVSKGALILLLLIRHFPSATTRLGIDETSFEFVNCWSILYSCFFMQAFFIMSGLCTNFSKPLIPFFIGLLRRLLIPLVVFEMIILIGHSLRVVHEISFQWMLHFWLESNGTHLWFLNALIVSKLYVWCFVRISRSDALLLLSSLLILCIAVALNQFNYGTNFFCIRQSLGSIFFVALGYILKKEMPWKSILVKMGYVFPYVLLFILLFGYSVPTFTAMINVSMKQVPIFLFLSISGSMALFSICKRIQHQEVLEYFGRDSLVVYGLHFLPLMLLVDVMYKWISHNTLVERLAMVLVVYIIEIFICVLLIELFKVKPFKWLVGKY